MDAISHLSPIKLTPLRRIEHPKGDIFHGIKASEASYAGFGEAYFTTIIASEVKGWKMHTAMTMNLIVPLGMVRFHIRDNATGCTVSYDIGATNYQRLTVPAGFWVAFQGLTNETNLILNVASLEHNPEEAVNVPLTTYSLAEQ